MNRKATLLIVAAVAAILPAVAVADVMITGQVTMVGTQNTPVFILQPGPNYLKAYDIGSINLSTGTGGQVGVQCVQPPAPDTVPVTSIDLQGIANQTTYLINVVDLNITKGTGTLWVNVTASDLPTGTSMYITSENDTQMTFSELMANAVAIDTTGTVWSQSVTAGDVYYIGFILPPGMYEGTGATLSFTFHS